MPNAGPVRQGQSVSAEDTRDAAQELVSRDAARVYGAALNPAAVTEPGAENLRVKEVRIAEDERFVICRNPEGAERDAAIRARMIAQLKELVDGTDALSKDKRAELRASSRTSPG